MDHIDWQNIKVMIWSEGMLTDPFIEKLRLRYPGITVHIRKQVMEGISKIPSIYAHPDVADFDISFSRLGDKEQILIRCVNRHRLFDYRPDAMREDAWRRELFLRFVTDAMPNLIGPPPRAAAEEIDDDPEYEDDESQD